MKKLLFVAAFVLLGGFASAQQWLQVTAVESVVPGGLGRSRLITMSKDGKMEEVKIENFFSMVGINFGNIRNNDQVICEKITELTKEGWELKFVTTGVESDAGKDDGSGLFITRYIFYKK
ncbi:MAG: hypothetical protein V2A54_07380 [Bacteroidota bacterium]